MDWPDNQEATPQHQETGSKMEPSRVEDKGTAKEHLAS